MRDNREGGRKKWAEGGKKEREGMERGRGSGREKERGRVGGKRKRERERERCTCIYSEIVTAMD